MYVAHHVTSLTKRSVIRLPRKVKTIKYKPLISNSSLSYYAQIENWRMIDWQNPYEWMEACLLDFKNGKRNHNFFNSSPIFLQINYLEWAYFAIDYHSYHCLCRKTFNYVDILKTKLSTTSLFVSGTYAEQYIITQRANNAWLYRTSYCRWHCLSRSVI